MSTSLNACRICLSTTYKSIDDNKNYLLMFEFCTGLTIGDTLPRLLCEKCINDLEHYTKFKKKCAESELYWESLRASEKVKNKDNETIFKDDSNSYEEFVELNKDYTNNDLYKDCNHEGSLKVKQYFKTNKATKKCITRKKISQTMLQSSDTDTKESHKCGLCYFTCSSFDEMNNHLENHWAKNNLKCEICDYVGRDFADMVTHRYNHAATKTYSCFICKLQKGSLLTLQYHFRHAHLNQVGGWCDICGKTFKVFKSWRTHMLYHKRDKRLLICAYCDKRYLYKYQIEEHIIYHLRKSQFVCETCGRSFNKKHNLKCHQRNVHSVNVPIKCGHCDKVYKNQGSLDVHLKEVTRDKPYMCDHCPKSFSLPSLLKKHSFFHTGLKPYVCDVCGLEYKTRGSLKCHQLKHLGIYKHKCRKCMRSFTTSVQLRRHLTVHTGDRKFKCLYCDKSFNEKSRLDSHIAKHKDKGEIKTES